MWENLEQRISEFYSVDYALRSDVDGTGIKDCIPIIDYWSSFALRIYLVVYRDPPLLNFSEDYLLALWTLVQHTKFIDDHRRFFFLFKRLARSQPESAFYFTSIEDKILVLSGMKQKYGTQYRNESGKSKIISPDSIRLMQIRRKFLGLENIDAFL